MKKGMNPEAVDQMAGQVESAGDDIQQAYAEVQGRVTDFDWTGEDRDKYVSEFESTIGDLVKSVAQQATELADRARRNASEQREASS